MHVDTKCIHAGGFSDSQTKGINTPIFTSSAYEYLVKVHRAPPERVDVRRSGFCGLLYSRDIADVFRTPLTRSQKWYSGLLYDQRRGRSAGLWESRGCH
jgi:hypothetical protein